MKRLLLLLALAVPAHAAPATFTISTAGGTPIRHGAVNGFNLGNWMPVVEARDLLRSVAPTSLRFPGGNVGDENDLTENALFTFRTNVGLLRATQPAELIVHTRVFGGKPGAANRPEDAAEAARAAKKLGIEVAYWEIGNEPNLYARNRNDPSWTPEKYCSTFRAQRAAILKVDPQARFAGPAVSNPDVFLEDFVRLCGDVVDLLTWHVYPSDGTKTDEEALASVRNVTDTIERYKALLRDPKANPLGHARKVDVGVTEYGLSYLTARPRHLSDQMGALWAAEATLRLAEGGAAIANYFALQATGAHGLVDLAGFPRPTLYAFQQLRHFKGTALPTTASDPALWTHAARDGNLLTVLVTNTARDGRELATDVPGYQLIGVKTFTEQTVRDEKDFIRLPLDPAVALPGRSLTRLAYKRLP